MKLNKLLIALTIAAPAVFTVACGGNETRGMAEQTLQPAPDIETPAMNTRSAEPEQDVVDAVYAEITAPVTPPEEQLEAETSMESDAEETLAIAESATEKPDVSTFYFATDDSTVKQMDIDEIVRHAEYLIQNPQLKIRLTGHTDQSGPVEYNRWLAAERARAVAKLLMDHGVDAQQISTEAMGAERPVVGLEHAIADRRVELEYMDSTRLTEANSF